MISIYRLSTVIVASMLVISSACPASAQEGAGSCKALSDFLKLPPWQRQVIAANNEPLPGCLPGVSSYAEDRHESRPNARRPTAARKPIHRWTADQNTDVYTSTSNRTEVIIDGVPY